jgi:hypothetical protein
MEREGMEPAKIGVKEKRQFTEPVLGVVCPYGHPVTASSKVEAINESCFSQEYSCYCHLCNRGFVIYRWRQKHMRANGTSGNSQIPQPILKL